MTLILRMHEDGSRLYASAPMQALFAHEQAALAPILSGVYGNHGLFLRPHPAAPVALPAHLLGTLTGLALTSAGQFSGAVCCSPPELPFTSKSFQLLIVQHVLERVDGCDQFSAELARVLAPEGVALILGFNPFGSWRPWLAWRSRRDGVSLQFHSARVWQQRLAREQIDTLQVRYPGWLGVRSLADGIDAPIGSNAWLARFGSSWLLLARKRRSTLTPLRLRAVKRELAINPHLAPGARRDHA